MAFFLPLAIFKEFNFFRKTDLFFLKKNLKLERFEKSYTLVAFYSNFATLCDFMKVQDFFRDTYLLFFQRKQIFECFEETYYFSRIPRQICYNLMKKISDSWMTDVGSFTRAQSANNG